MSEPPFLVACRLRDRIGRCRKSGCSLLSHFYLPLFFHYRQAHAPLNVGYSLFTLQFIIQFNNILNSPQGHRKTLAIKRGDGEPLTRADLQYDLLDHIFSNDQEVFTDPYQTLDGSPPGTKVTFRDLYVNAIIHSPRCSRACRDKIIEIPQFGVEFGKISLLSNVGRINTTMACEYVPLTNATSWLVIVLGAFCRNAYGVTCNMSAYSPLYRILSSRTLTH